MLPLLRYKCIHKALGHNMGLGGLALLVAHCLSIWFVPVHSKPKGKYCSLLCMFAVFADSEHSASVTQGKKAVTV